MKKIPFAYSIHPGEILKTEFMEPLGLSSYRLAKDLHVSAPRVNDIVLGKRSISRYRLAPQRLLRQLRRVLAWIADGPRSVGCRKE
jgi:hypothetical protein